MLSLKKSNPIQSLWPCDTIWWHRSGSTLSQVMAFCLTALQAITWTNVYSSSKLIFGLHLRAMPQEVLLNCGLATPLWPSDAIRQQGTESTLAQVMACCLTAPSHYLNQCWLIISNVLRSCGIHQKALSWEDLKIPISQARLKITFLESNSDLPEANELICNMWSEISFFKITPTSPRCQWVNASTCMTVKWFSSCLAVVPVS